MRTQRRVAAGTPTGGQFARHERAESDLSLEPITATTALAPEDALRIAELQARNHAGRLVINSLDREDIAQDALLSVITSRRNQKVDGISPGLITNAVRHAVAAAVMRRTATMRHEDAKAVKMFRQREEALAQDLGREPERSELDALATTIRNGWADPRHKPRVGFHRPVTIEPYVGRVRAAANSIPSPPETERTELDDLADRVESGAVPVTEAKRRLWNTIAKAEALPLVRTPERARSDANTLRRKLLAGGGAAAIAAAYVRTQTLTEQTMQLLEPFDVSPAERERIGALAQHLACRGRIAQRLWDAALDATVS